MGALLRRTLYYGVQTQTRGAEFPVLIWGNNMLLSELARGQAGVVEFVEGQGSVRRHLLDMGLTPNAVVTLQKTAPMGDPIQVTVRGYELTLRLNEANNVRVRALDAAEDAAAVGAPSATNASAADNASATGSTPATAHREPVPHPGLGEFGPAEEAYRAHARRATAKTGPLTFALVGNQNCGKTTLFNQLTGANQHVGNFPGVTVDRKDGTIRAHAEATVTDLPGVYSLSPYSNEEIVTRDFLLNEKPDGIINIVDGTNIERNLYLTMQIMELGIPMVLALNMMDEVEANGGTIRVNELEAELGIPVVPISAAKNEGVDELVDHALHVARFDEAPGRIDFCPASEHEHDPLGAVHRCIHATGHIIEPYADQAKIPTRFAATKMVEGDELIARKLDLPESAISSIRELTASMQADAGMDAEAALANMRFAFLANLCANTVVRPQESREHKRSAAVDKLLTGRYTGIPCFFAIMAAVFVLTFSFIGAALSDLVSAGVDVCLNALAAGCEAWGLNPVAQSLLVDGVGAGVGAVIGFLPTIVTLFFFLSILEDSGYMARVAFVMDRPHAQNRPVRALLRAAAHRASAARCPSIMATRTLSSERDRKMTTMLVPFMSCSAKLPIYALIVGAFFPRVLQPVVMIGLYAFGVVVGIVVRCGAEAGTFPRSACAVRDGAAELPPARREKRGAPGLGQGEGLREEGVHRGVGRVRDHLVPANIRRAPERGGRRERQPACGHRRADCPAVRAAGLRRLARGHGAYDRLHGEGERGVHVDPGHGWSRLDHAVHAGDGVGISGVRAAVHAVRGGHRHRAQRAGRRACGA